MAYTKTNWQNLPSTNTPINDSNLNKIENELANKDIITVGLSTNYTFSVGGGFYLTLDSIFSQIGNKLTLDNGKIIIGAGINHILVSGQFHNQIGSVGGVKSFFIGLNGTEIAYSQNSGIGSNIDYSKAIAPKLIAVSENDSIEFGVQGNNGDVIDADSSKNYITVEVVD